MNAGKEKDKDSPNQGEKHIQQYKQSAFHRFEGVEQENKNQKDTDGHDDQQPLHGSLLVLELTTPAGCVAGRKGDTGIDSPLHLIDDTPHVPTSNENADRGDTHAGFPADVHAPALHVDGCHLFQRNTQTSRRINQDGLDRGNVPALVLTQSDNHAKSALSFPDLRRHLSSQRCLNDVFDVRNIETIASRLLSLDLNL